MKWILLLTSMVFGYWTLAQDKKDSLVIELRSDTLFYTVHFDKDKSVLTSIEQEQLDDMMRKIATEDLITLFIYGHTDSDGDEIYNEKLSKRRCETVWNSAKKSGLEDSKLLAIPFGEKHLLKNELTKADKAANRRVELIAVFQREYERWIPCGGTYHCPDTIVFLPNGTGLKLDTCALKQKLECIKIEEYVTPELAREGGFHTMDTDGVPLRSGGMIKYDLCAGRTVDVLIPIRENCFEPEMDLYEQTEDGWRKIEGRKPEMVEVQGQRYYSFSISGNGIINCDVQISFPSRPPKVIFKAKKGLQLKEVRLSCDCPFMIQAGQSVKGKGKKVKLIRNCCPELEVQIVANSANGEVLVLPYGSIDRLKHRKSLIACKEQVRKRILGIPIRKKIVYRVYKVREKDFKK